MDRRKWPLWRGGRHGDSRGVICDKFFKEGQHDYCAKFMLTAVSHNDNPAFANIIIQR